MGRNGSAIDWDEIHRRLAESEALMDRAFLPDAGQARKILASRAKHFQNRSHRENRAKSKVKPVLSFQAGNEKFGLELSRLKAVIRLQDLTPLPAVAPEILGIISIHEAIWTVLDLARIAGLPTARKDSRGYALLLRRRDQNIALAVENTGSILSIPESDITALAGRPGTAGAGCSAGLLPGKITLLNADAICEQNYGGEAV